MSNPKPVVAVTRKVPGELVVPGAEVRILSDRLEPLERIHEFIAGCDILVPMYTNKVDVAMLDAAGANLKGVCNFAVGYNNVDVEACRARGIVVTNTPDAVTEGTADIAWLHIMAAARRLIEADRFARTGAWHEHGSLGMAEFLGLDLTGRTLHIVGAGRIGYAVAIRALAWGMKILYTARTRKWNFELAPVNARRVKLDEGLAEADVVSIHTPLTDETHHLIDARRLGLMKRTAILVNTSRGPVVDEAALAAALRDKRIWGAGLDVFESEPRVHPDLVGLDNVTMTPHIGSGEIRFREEMTNMVAANAAAILKGEAPPNRVC
ncbi:MAG: D-glycerate dehydrogenase [Phycisphaeraceae bacterium]|nr:MAG: D-glycerate dehydrogenase [Phycisphaeraceae bacterium]